MTAPIAGRATYGELLDLACAHVAAGAAALALGPLNGPVAARETITAYRDLLAAIHAHGRALFGPHRLASAEASAATDPADTAAVRLLAELKQFNHRRRARGSPTREETAQRLSAAARLLGAATDLLSTHRDADGVARTPESFVIEQSTARAAGEARLGSLVCAVLASARDLGLRAGQAGMPWPQVHRILPEPTSLQAAANALVKATTSDAAQPVLEQLTVARPEIRTNNPGIELADRLLRLRQISWQLTREPQVGIGTLSDFAAAAVIFHTHAVALVRGGGGGSSDGAAMVAEPGRLVQARHTWSQIHLQSRELHTATPAAAVVRADTKAIRELCNAALLPLDTTARFDDPELGALVHGGARAFREIAAWNASVLSRLGATGQLYLPARTLTGAQVSEDPQLVVAKLRGGMVRLPRRHVQYLIQTYDAAAALGVAAPLRSSHGRLLKAITAMSR